MRGNDNIYIFYINMGQVKEKNNLRDLRSALRDLFLSLGVDLVGGF